MFSLTKRVLAGGRRDGAVADDVFKRAQVIENKDEGDTHIVTMFDPETGKFFYEYTDRNGNWLGESDA